MQARKTAISEHPPAWAKKPKRLLSGLLKCALCGSGMSLNGGRYQCTGYKERGTCSNTKIIAAERVEKRVLAGVRDHLLSPEAIAQAVRDMREQAERDRKAVLVERAPMERELAEIARRLARAQTMCMDGAIEIADLKGLSEPLKARRRELQDRLASASQAPSPVQVHPRAASAYQRLAANLHEALEREDAEEMRGELRKLIERVDFMPLPEHGQFDLRVHGRLADLLRISEGSADCGVGLGAGTGFEPVTFRL